MTDELRADIPGASRWRTCPVCKRSIVPSRATRLVGMCNDCEIRRALHGDGGKRRTGQTRHCPDCGQTLKPRARLCPDCRQKRRRESYRAAQRARRQQLTLSEG